jgi:mannose-6-phosphate isomerase-like protein (cupin superfamily)
MAALDRKQILDPESGRLLHEVIRGTARTTPIEKVERVDFSEPKEFLQGAVIEIPANHSFRPHVHLDRVRSFTHLRAQESWVVIKGQVEVDYFTELGAFIGTEVLTAGDITITFLGGHGYRTLTSDALVYEFKSGPYEGLEIDKRFI